MYSKSDKISAKEVVFVDHDKLEIAFRSKKKSTTEKYMIPTINSTQMPRPPSMATVVSSAEKQTLKISSIGECHKESNRRS